MTDDPFEAREGMSDEPTIRIRDGSLVTRYEYDMMEKQAQKAKANRQVKFDSSLDYTDLVAELRSGEDGLEYASADAIEALMARIAELEAALRETYEVYAGSDGFIPETAAEGYQQQLIKQMVEIIGAALAKENNDLRAARAALGEKE